MRTDSGLFQFSVFSRLPLGGKLLAKQGGEGCRYLQHGKQSGEQMRTDSGLFQFSVFSRLPLGGGSLRSKVVRGAVIRIPASRAAQSAGRGLFQFSVFSRLPLGGRLLAEQGGEGCRYPHPGKQSGEQLQHLLSPLGRVASNREPREVCLKLISPLHVCKKYTFSNRLKCRKNTYNKLRRFFLCGNGFGTTRQQSLSP